MSSIRPEVILRAVQKKLQSQGVTVTELIIGNESHKVPFIGVVVEQPGHMKFSACMKWDNSQHTFAMADKIVDKINRHLEGLNENIS